MRRLEILEAGKISGLKHEIGQAFSYGKNTSAEILVRAQKTGIIRPADLSFYETHIYVFLTPAS